jgi:hypothetical protein
VAADAIESSLLKYSAKEYFFKSALCHMCIDALEAQRAVDKYCDMYAAFQDTRECKLLKVKFSFGIGNSSYRVNFDLGKKNKIHHHS